MFSCFRMLCRCSELVVSSPKGLHAKLQWFVLCRVVKTDLTRAALQSLSRIEHIKPKLPSKMKTVAAINGGAIFAGWGGQVATSAGDSLKSVLQGYSWVTLSAVGLF